MKGLQQITETLKAEQDELISLSKQIHANPELGSEEFFASNLICDYLEAKGFTVQRGVADLDTAFIASFERGIGGCHVTFCAEYDALPEIGHACGHNLIGIASVAAGVALASSASDVPCKVSVMGTPDEERRGGKVDLIQAGVFADVDVAMMFHPGYTTIIHCSSLAFQSYQFIFHGVNAHAASEPWEGRNALDGAIQTFNGINALRQHIKDDVRIHGIIREGGMAPNIVPDRAVAEFFIRSLDNSYLQEVVERVLNCARGAALSTGTTLEVKPIGHFYDAMKSNRALADTFAASLDEVGFVDRTKHQEGMGSIDMGNVSNVVPAIHPVLCLTEQHILGHTHEFAELCNTDDAYQIMLLAGRAMALTGYKVITDKQLQAEIKEEFQQTK